MVGLFLLYAISYALLGIWGLIGLTFAIVLQIAFEN